MAFAAIDAYSYYPSYYPSSHYYNYNPYSHHQYAHHQYGQHQYGQHHYAAQHAAQQAAAHQVAAYHGHRGFNPRGYHGYPGYGGDDTCEYIYEKSPIIVEYLILWKKEFKRFIKKPQSV